MAADGGELMGAEAELPTLVLTLQMSSFAALRHYERTLGAGGLLGLR